MSNSINKPPYVNAPDDSRRAFESAIAQVQPRSERSLSQTPIVDRSRIGRASDPTVEKRALTDAARALARLWKVSPALVR